MNSFLDTYSRRLAIAVECGTSNALIRGDSISGKWSNQPRIWTPSRPLSIAEELLNSVDSVSVDEIPKRVLKFTKDYGPLILPFQSGKHFDFPLSEWLGKRAEFIGAWKILSAGVARDGPVQVGIDKGDRFEFTSRELRFCTARLAAYVSLELAAVPPGRLRICHNRLNGCKTPYFFATDLRNRYCSESCSKAAIREAKLRWWNE